MASVRRLSAIMFTDMVGSTASAQVNEVEALRLRDEQADLVRPLFAAHQGREIKSMGDGFLAEFDSALRAVQCAIDIQQHLHERNSKPGVARILLRIGIHLGDVEQRGTDIFGDAVNIASRIEPLASPGEVCISGEVFSQVRNKIPNRLEKLPPKSLKGLEVRIDLYRVVLPWAVRAAAPHDNGPVRLAVLPFANMSPDPADLYFADGLTEELITVLSQLREFRVIARTSVMQYKSTTMEVSQIGTNLDVSSILEGSVRRAGNRLRITAQLIDVSSQEHVWAKSYDRELDDVFVIQTEIATQVADALKVELRPTETARFKRSSPVRPDSYLAYLKGRALLESVWSEQSIRAAKRQFELALSLDETNARAHSGLADAIKHLKWGIFDRLPDEQDSIVREHVVRALELDPDLAEAHNSLGLILWDDFAQLEAEREFRLALSLNPSYAYAHSSLAHLMLTFGRVEEALREFVLAGELDPNSWQNLQWHLTVLMALRRVDEATGPMERLRELDRGGPSYYELLTYSQYARSDFERALQTTDRAEELKSEAVAGHRIWIYSAMGKKEEAWKLIRQQEARPEKHRPEELAMWRAAVGDLDGCFQYLDEAFKRKQLAIQMWRIEPTFEPVRRDPRFGQLLKKMNLP